MKKLDLGQTVSILANVGVIAGIVFLGLELRQNNSLLTAQSAYALLNTKFEYRARLIDNTNGFAEIFQKRNSGEQLTPVERIRVNLFAHEILDIFRWQFREFQAGRLPDDYIDLRTWHDLWDQIPRLPELFQGDKPRLDAEFVQFVEENVVNR